MSSYDLSEDLARFGEMAKSRPKLFDHFMKRYGAAMEPGALDGRTQKLERGGVHPRRRDHPALGASGQCPGP